MPRFSPWPWNGLEDVRRGKCGGGGDFLNFSYTELCCREILSKPWKSIKTYEKIHQGSSAVHHPGWRGFDKHREIGTIRKNWHHQKKNQTIVSFWKRYQPVVGLVPLNPMSCTWAMDWVRKVCRVRGGICFLLKPELCLHTPPLTWDSIWKPTRKWEERTDVEMADIARDTFICTVRW